MDDFDKDKFRLAVLYLLEGKGKTQKALAAKAKVNPASLTYLLNSEDYTLPIEQCHCIRKALGAKTFSQLYMMGDKAAQEDCFDKDKFKAAVFYLLESKGMPMQALADEAGLHKTGLGNFLKHENGSMSVAACRQVSKALGAKTFAELYAMGERAAQENPFDRERFRTALSNLLHSTHKKAIVLEEEAELGNGRLSFFLHQDGPMSIAACHRIREACGAETFRAFYRMGGVPLPSAKNNGAGGIVASLLNTPIHRDGRISEKPITLDK